MKYQEALEYIMSCNQYAGEMGLDNIRNLLDELDNPQRQLKFIHVGGTNGKGSVSSFVSTILAESGYRVGRYISPTILSYCERIQIVEKKNEKIKISEIEENQVVRWILKIKEACERMIKKGFAHPTPFEIETVMGFLEFIQKKCDIVVLEVGMGGKTDATNIIDTGVVEVLTSISRDHIAFLGDTVEKITREKCGILKKAVPVVAYDYNEQYKEIGEKDEVTAVIEERAKEEDASLIFSDFTKIQIHEEGLMGTKFDYEDIKDIFCPLVGRFQTQNAALAIDVSRVLCRLGWNININDIREGIKNTVWKGRFEVLNQNGVPYIIDGAHNEDGARVLAKNLELYLKNKKILFIVGILADKNYKAILSYTGKYANKIFTITPENERALEAKELANVAKEYCQEVVSFLSIEAAMEQAKHVTEIDVVVIFGSLYSLQKVYECMEK